MPSFPATDLLTTTLLFTLLPMLALVAGAGVAIVKPPSPAWRSAILHFAAGVVFAVVAVELLPDIIRRRAPLEVGIGFVMGLGVMLVLRMFTRRLEAREEAAHTLPLGLLAGVGIDIFIDGLLLGIVFATGTKEGMLLAVALTVEILSLGLATGVELQQQGSSKRQTLLLTAGISLTLLAGAGVGLSFLQHAPNEVMETVLSFGLAALLFLVTEELLSEAHEDGESPLITSCFFVGFLLFLLLGMVV